MQSKSILVLFDTCVILESFRTGSWDALISNYAVILSQTVIEESLWYYDFDGYKHSIDWKPYISENKIQIIDPSISDMEKFLSEFDSSYAERMDIGELSLLCYLFAQPTEEIYICSSDEIVFKILGKHRRSEQGISLEELLKKIGFNKPINDHFKKDFRERCSKKGFENSFT